LVTTTLMLGQKAEKSAQAVPALERWAQSPNW
jgi:hypothetical protein